MIRPAFTEIGIFLIPFAVYALILFASRSGMLVQSSWPLHVVARLLVGSLLLVIVASFCSRIFPARRRIRPTSPPISRTANSSPELKNERDARAR